MVMLHHSVNVNKLDHLDIIILLFFAGSDASCDDKSSKTNLKTTYIRWGSKKCGTNAKLIYSGKK